MRVQVPVAMDTLKCTSGRDPTYKDAVRLRSSAQYLLSDRLYLRWDGLILFKENFFFEISILSIFIEKFFEKLIRSSIRLLINLKVTTNKLVNNNSNNNKNNNNSNINGR